MAWLSWTDDYEHHESFPTLQEAGKEILRLREQGCVIRRVENADGTEILNEKQLAEMDDCTVSKFCSSA